MLCCMAVLWPARDRGSLPEPRESKDLLEKKVLLENWLPFDRGKRRFKSTVTPDDLSRYRTGGDCVSPEAAVVKLVSGAHDVNTRTINRRTDCSSSQVASSSSR